MHACLNETPADLNADGRFVQMHKRRLHARSEVSSREEEPLQHDAVVHVDVSEEEGRPAFNSCVSQGSYIGS